MAITDRQRREAVEAHLGPFKPLPPGERKSQLAELRRLLNDPERRVVLSAFERACTLADWELIDTLGDPAELDKRVRKAHLLFARLRGAYLSGRLLDQSELKLGYDEGAAIKLLDGKLFPLKSLEINDPGGPRDRFSRFPTLEALDVDVPYSDRDDAWKDLAPLAGLLRLRRFSLREVPALQDISGLAAHPQLESLKLNAGEALEDVSVLATLTQLESLDLHGCTKLEDLSSLAKLTSLRSIRLCASAITDLGPLAHKPQLEVLDLDGCEQLKGGLAPITRGGGARLRELHLRGSGIRDLSSLAAMPALFALDGRTLQPNTGLDKVTGLDALEEVWVHGKLGTLAFLAGARGLRSLQVVASPDLETLDALRGHEALVNLSVAKCPALRDVSGVSRLQQLAVVSLHGCKSLVDVSPLGELPSLRKLHVEECPVPKSHRVSRETHGGYTEDKGEIARLQRAYRAAHARAEAAPAPTADGRTPAPVQPTGARRAIAERDRVWMSMEDADRKRSLAELRKSLGSARRDEVVRALEAACNACNWELLEALAEGISVTASGEVLLSADAELCKRVKRAHHALLPRAATRLALATARFGDCTSLPDETLRLALDEGGFSALPPGLTRKHREAAVNAALGVTPSRNGNARKEAAALLKLLAPDASAETVAQGRELLKLVTDFSVMEALAEGVFISACGDIRVEQNVQLGIAALKKDQLEVALRVLAGSGRLLGAHTLVLPMARPLELLAELGPFAPRVRWVRVDARSVGLRAEDIQEGRHAPHQRWSSDKPTLDEREQALWVKGETRSVLVVSETLSVTVTSDTLGHHWQLRALNPTTQERLYAFHLGRREIDGMRLQPDGRLFVQLGDDTALVLDVATGRVMGRPRNHASDGTLDMRVRLGTPPVTEWACWQNTPRALEAQEEDE